MQLRLGTWLCSSGCVPMAARGVRTRVILQLWVGACLCCSGYANGCPWDEGTCRGAAWGGHLAVLQWLRANGCPWDEAACGAAARRGHLVVLQWLRANGCQWVVGFVGKLPRMATRLCCTGLLPMDARMI
jgi:hypothetical protein